MYTIGTLAKLSGLSRSTLLYYDSIGLLVCQHRSSAGYRLYTEADKQRLLTVLQYRDAGLSLEQIAELLDTQVDNRAVGLLQDRLAQMNNEIAQLRKQQQQLVAMLGDQALHVAARSFSKSQWVAVLEAAGLNEEDQRRWHQAFEQQMPLAHQDFLEALQIAPDEFRAIRAWSRGAS